MGWLSLLARALNVCSVSVVTIRRVVLPSVLLLAVISTSYLAYYFHALSIRRIWRHHDSSDDVIEVVRRRLPDTQYNLTGEESDPFVRASVVFMPSKGPPHLSQELRWHHLSWSVCRSYLAVNWRLDLVVVSDSWLDVFRQLGCEEGVRKDYQEPSRCVVWSSYPSVQTSPSDALFNYPVVDSVRALHLAYAAGVTLHYHLVLRTDLDTFLTPMLARWRPEPSGALLVGGGAYQWDHIDHRYITSHRLRRVSRDLNWTDSGLSNVGSTWLGPPDKVAQCAKLAVHAMRHLHQHEFTLVAKAGKLGTDLWPEWHYGVLALYGGHLAINHCSNLPPRTPVLQQNDTFDADSTFDTCSVLKVPHIHSWHNVERFSKFAFKSGKYSHLSLDDLNLRECRDWAVFMAEYSRRHRTMAL